MAIGPSESETRHLRTLFELGAVGILTDGQLLERFATRGGDPGELAFAVLVERHGPMVLRVARSALLDEHSAHDAFQATFLILARKARALWVRDSLGPWLHAVAFRVASRARKAEARRHRLERIAARPEAFSVAGPDRDDLPRAIHEEIERLPEPYRGAVVTCHLEGRSQIEAARSLGWPLGTLQSRLARGRQRLRDRLKRRGFAPTLSALAGKLAPPPDALIASTARASATLQGGGALAGMIAPTVLAMIDATSKGMLMTKLKIGAAALVILGGLVASTSGLVPARAVQTADELAQAPRAEAPKAEPARDEPALVAGPPPAVGAPLAPVVQGDDEPALTVISTPKPWETVARIKVRKEGSAQAVNSGVVIQSTMSDSLVLTAAHNIVPPDAASGNTRPEDWRGRISVDFFDGRLGTRPGSPAMVGCLRRDLPATLKGYDLESNLALLLVETRGLIPAVSPLVPLGWKPLVGSKMHTVGCSNGNDATAWDTTILDDQVWINEKMPDHRPVAVLKCAHEPRPGRGGGGLFTLDGQLAGVCLFADPQDHSGLYATPGTIRKFLNNQGLGMIYGDNSPARPPTVETEPLLSPVPDPTLIPGAIRRDARPQAETSTPPALEPVPPRSVSEQDRRIEALERKLDQLVNAIQALKGEVPKIEGSFPGPRDLKRR